MSYLLNHILHIYMHLYKDALVLVVSFP
uniref:Uncharacterized protein n=1 Tax=Arundo donax TaxID=35708 RepID=A0A0A9BBN4_ARUDO